MKLVLEPANYRRVCAGKAAVVLLLVYFDKPVLYDVLTGGQLKGHSILDGWYRVFTLVKLTH